MSGPTGEARGERPATTEAALQRARQHARRAAAEALRAARALLDAASLAAAGRPADAPGPLAAIARGLDRAGDALDSGDAPLPTPIVEAILDALDQEIARWEQRAASDAEARAVLRAFLGMREILWEFGLRRTAAAETAPAPGRARARTRRPDAEPRSSGSSPRGARVQRVRVQG